MTRRERAALRAALDPLLWTESEPDRLARELSEVQAFDPSLTYVPPDFEDASLPTHNGYWFGTLVPWPFDRPVPDGLEKLVPEGLQFAMFYQASHPMTPPIIVPRRPVPTPLEHSQHRWHVSPAGHLCLLQHDGLWDPGASTTELLLKAAGWRIEYALMKAGAISTMTPSGIVSDTSLDSVIEIAAAEPAPAPAPAPAPEEP